MNAITKNENNTVATGAVNNQAWIAPEVNIYENKAGYVLQAELPGVSRTGLEVTVENNTLTLTGHRTDETPPGNALYRESRPASFRRVFELAPTIDTTRISARVEQGVLTLSLPKIERVKPRKIAVEE